MRENADSFLPPGSGVKFDNTKRVFRYRNHELSTSEKKISNSDLSYFVSYR